MASYRSPWSTGEDECGDVGRGSVMEALMWHEDTLQGVQKGTQVGRYTC